MKIPERLAEEAFWELENNTNLEVLNDCLQIAKNKAQARELILKLEQCTSCLLRRKPIEEAKRLIKTEELWDEIKKKNNSRI